jgi:3-hydroxyacyl-[acyl-carrier-protein] dehydratase
MPDVNNEIFGIDELEHSDGTISVKLSINKNSAIFEGHFPVQPVVPGACMLQLVKDVLETALVASLILKKAGSLKFISMIDPVVNTSAYLEISYKTNDAGDITANAKLSANAVVCFKFQGVFRVI